MDKLRAQAGAAPVWPLTTNAVPEEISASMPAQSLSRWRAEGARPDAGADSITAALRRLLVLGAALAGTAVASYAMYEVMAVTDLTYLQIVVLILFVPNFAWIALWFVNAIAGFFHAASGSSYLKAPKLAPGTPMILSKRTALLVPTYNEAPARVFANVQAMYEALRAIGALRSFDFFILSDTTEPAIWLAEETGFYALRQRCGGGGHIYYRHRPQNLHRKSGNVEDFCRRWGMRYDYMIVLDADSLMTAEALLQLAASMERHPEAGIIQTSPQIVNGGTLFARLQQFASRAFGPVVSGGLAFWHMGDSNYWGHNAIIRIRAFIDHAGLPVLPGRTPFGGQILSHDFVEAALVRRGGWKIYMANEIEGSYEESPPGLIDFAARDRRWCQGNLQHMALLNTSGMYWLSRLHLGLGIYGYLASPVWLSFLLVGMLLSLQAHYIRPEYFAEGFQLFPSWPVMNPELAASLFIATMGVLLGPKIFGVLLVLRDREITAQFGGRIKLLVGLLIETLLSSFTAPVMMLIQTGAVIGALAGRDVGWSTQRRGDDQIPFAEIYRRHRNHTILGVVIGVAALAVSPQLLAWMSPVVLGLLLAIPMSALGASRRIGKAVAKLGLLQTPEEVNPPAVLVRSREILSDLEMTAVSNADPLLRIAQEPELREAHLSMLPPVKQALKGEVDVNLVVAMAKLEQAGSVQEAVAFLTVREKQSILGSASAIGRLLRLPVLAAE